MRGLRSRRWRRRCLRSLRGSSTVGVDEAFRACDARDRAFGRGAFVWRARFVAKAIILLADDLRELAEQALDGRPRLFEDLLGARPAATQRGAGVPQTGALGAFQNARV